MKLIPAHILIISFAFFAISSTAQQDKPIHVLGKVQTASGEALPFAFIVNSATGIGKETNEKGLFKIQVCVSDTILFRSLGYEDALWPVAGLDLSSEIQVFNVVEKSYALESVDVLSFRSYATFRHKVANMEISDDTPAINMGSMFGEHFMADMTTLASKNAQRGAGVDLLAIPMLVGKALIKRKPKLDLSQKEKIYERYNRMTSRQNLQSFTKFEGVKLDSFIVFLRSKHKINPRLSDYEMMEAINLVYEEFLALQTDTIIN